MDENNYEFLVQRSNIYVNMKNYDKAIENLTKALSIKGDDAQILYKRGLAYYKNKNYKNCIKDMFNSLQHSPFIAYQCDIYYHLGISFANLEMYDKSIEPLSKVFNH